jgi:hypothetical protein
MLSREARVHLGGKLASQSSSLSSYLVFTSIFIAVRLLLAEILPSACRPLWLLLRSACSSKKIITANMKPQHRPQVRFFGRLEYLRDSPCFLVLFSVITRKSKTGFDYKQLSKIFLLSSSACSLLCVFVCEYLLDCTKLIATLFSCRAGTANSP